MLLRPSDMELKSTEEQSHPTFSSPELPALHVKKRDLHEVESA
jgi:hypothetical protein